MFVDAFDTLKIPENLFEGRFILLCHFHRNLKIQNSWLYWLSTFRWLPATTFVWSDRQIPGWPQFFQQQVFSSVPSLVDFNRTIFEVSTSILCANVATPITSYRLFSSLCRSRRMAHPRNCSPAPSPLVSIDHWQSFPKASSLSSRVQIGPLRLLRTICFRKRKTPLAPSPACYLCQWAPAACPVFLLIKILKHEKSLHDAGMLILSNPILEFCISTPSFSSIILHYMFVQALGALKISERRFGTEILWRR